MFSQRIDTENSLEIARLLINQYFNATDLPIRSYSNKLIIKHVIPYTDRKNEETKQII